MDLLEAIVRCGSINQAAKLMGMSYKSAWSKLRTTEMHLNTKIVHSDRATGTRLTPAGEDILRKYKLMKQKCIAADDEIFNNIFNPVTIKNRSETDERGTGGTPPIVSFVGHSGSGKTTFIEKLIPILVAAGLKIAIIKHDVHGFDMDATMISSSNRIGLVMDADHDHQPHELSYMLGFADIIITEGFKRSMYPKLEVFRPEVTGDKAPLCQGDTQLLAIISDAGVEVDVPVFGLEEFQKVADFLRHFLRKRRHGI